MTLCFLRGRASSATRMLLYCETIRYEAQHIVRVYPHDILAQGILAGIEASTDIDSFSQPSSLLMPQPLKSFDQRSIENIDREID